NLDRRGFIREAGSLMPSRAPFRDAGSGISFYFAQVVEQGFGVFQVRRLEALGEPAVDGREEITGFDALALIAPEAVEAGPAAGGARRSSAGPAGAGPPTEQHPGAGDGGAAGRERNATFVPPLRPVRA